MLEMIAKIRKNKKTKKQKNDSWRSPRVVFLMNDVM